MYVSSRCSCYYYVAVETADEKESNIAAVDAVRGGGATVDAS